MLEDIKFMFVSSTYVDDDNKGMMQLWPQHKVQGYSFECFNYLFELG